MNRFDDRVKLDVFKSETTYQSDYKKFPIAKTTKPRHPTEDAKEAKKPPDFPYQDNETFVRWRPNSHIPFDLLWRPKEITRTDPYEPFQTPVLPETSAEKEAAIKTRPRIYMSPAISMDDVEDPNTRKLLCSHMYTSEQTKAIQESAVKSAKRHIPNTTVEAEGDPVRLKIDLLPPLPQNFRNMGNKWENSQIKYTVDPTKTFWEHKDPPVKCGACNDPVEGLVSNETKETIRGLIRTNKLRLAHDYPVPGYAGYKPRLSYGVSLAKKELPVVHPLLTVSQAITKRYEADYEAMNKNKNN